MSNQKTPRFLSKESLSELDTSTIFLFIKNWERIFPAWAIPYHGKSIDELIRSIETIKNRFFWHTITKECAEKDFQTLSALQHTTNISQNFINNIITLDTSINMPIAAGEKLLLLHEDSHQDSYFTQQLKIDGEKQ